MAGFSWPFWRQMSSSVRPSGRFASSRRNDSGLRGAPPPIAAGLPDLVRDVGRASWLGAPDPDPTMRALAAKDEFMDAGTWLSRTTPTQDEMWVHAAKEFVAIRISIFIRYVSLQMKNLLTFSPIALILGLAAVSAYKFQPRRPFMALIWVTLGPSDRRQAQRERLLRLRVHERRHLSGAAPQGSNELVARRGTKC